MTVGFSGTQEASRTAQSADPTGQTSYITGIADGNLATPVRLRDYLTGVGVVFRLPRRGPTPDLQKQVDAKAAADDRRKARVRASLRPVLYAAGVVTLLAVGALGWNYWVGSVPLPSAVAGTWTTSDGRYKGRNFWINQSSVAFQNGTGVDQFSVHPIRRISSRTRADTTFLSVEYEQEGKPITLSLAFRPSPVPEVRMVNQPTIRWYRAGNAPSL